MIPPKREMILCPGGSWQAVCYDVWSIGLQESNIKGKIVVLPKIIIAWELAETIEKGQRVGERYIINRRYTFSYNKKAWLRIDLESWLGRPFTERERTDFDVETMIGKNCFLSIIHKETDERTFANVQTVMSLPKGMPLITTSHRVCHLLHPSVLAWSNSSCGISLIICINEVIRNVDINITRTHTWMLLASFMNIET